MPAPPDFTPLTNAVINGIGQMLLWVIPILLVIGVINELLRRARMKERVREQIAYEDALRRERRKRGFEPELRDVPSWERSHEPTLDPITPEEESWHERVRKHTGEGVEYCPTCGKRR